MISYFLFEQPWLSTLVLVVLVIVGPLTGATLVPRPRSALIAGALSLLPMAWLTLAPYPRPVVDRCTVQWLLPTPGRAELMANVILFVVPALLFTVAFRRPAMVLAVAIALSMTIELVQASLPGTGRSCDTSDLLNNAIGAAVGAGLGLVAVRIARPPCVPERLQRIRTGN